MIQRYYSMTYETYKKHTQRFQGHWHTYDDTLTDESVLAVKVTGPDHVHDYLERQPEISLATRIPNDHPLVRLRGI